MSTGHREVAVLFGWEGPSDWLCITYSVVYQLRDQWPPVLLKAVRNRPDAARSRPDTARNSTVERSERNKSHTNYMLTTCSVPQFCHVQNEHGK